MNSLEKDFVPYEPSLALKELGFNEPCFGYYKENQYELHKEFHCYNSDYVEHLEVYIAAPTFSQAFRWFRDKYQIDSKIERDNSLQNLPKQYCYIIDDKDGLVEESINFNSYEEAELACLIKLIEITNEQQ